MGAARWVVLSVTALSLARCGGGSGAALPAPQLEQSFSAGLVRGDAPSAFPIVVTKPFAGAGVVELVAGDGPFATGALPMALPEADRFTLVVAFSPPPGPPSLGQHGTIDLLFRPAGGGPPVPVTLRLDAEIETPSARLLETRLVLGRAAVGETVPCAIAFENTSAVTPVAVTGAAVDAGDFSLAPDGAALPATVAPGDTYLVRLHYRAAAEADASSILRVFHAASAAPLEAVLEAGGVAAHEVTDFDAVPVDPVTGESPWLTLHVAPEAVGILLEAWGHPGVELLAFEGPSGRAYDLDWDLGLPAGAGGYLTAQVPDSTRPEVQLEPGGGAYRFRLRSVGADELAARATVTHRHRGEVALGTLDVRVFLATGLAVASDPARDPKLSAVLETIDAALGAYGVRLGEISFTAIADVSADVLATPDDTERMIAVCSPELPEARVVNLFLVNDVGYGRTGVAGAAPGPWSSAVPCAGVVAEYDGADAITVGVVAAHEIAHYLGWLGTSVLPAAADALPMLRHPLLRPAAPGDPLPAPAAQVEARARQMPSAPTWCDRCAHAPDR